MRRKFLGACPMRTSEAECAVGANSHAEFRGHDIDLGDQFEADLATAHQLDIDLREQFGIEQRAVQGAVAAVYAIARAQRIERIFRAGMTGAGERNGIDHPLHPKAGKIAHRQFGIDEAEVEPGIVRDQRAVRDEVEKFLRTRGEQRLVGKKRIGEAVDPLGFRRHHTLGIEVTVPGPAGRDPIDHFDAADLDQPVTSPWVEAGRFGIENYFAHR